MKTPATPRIGAPSIPGARFRRGEDDLAFAGIARQAELLRAGDVSARELVELYLERIRRLEPTVNAFRLVLAEEALAEADRVQGRLSAGEETPLLGVPVAVKDNVDVAGTSTMWGTGIDPGPAKADCPAVARLREAGAIILGKTHLPEMAAHPMCESRTWGVTRNPWAPERTAGGSSGGSAAAVAAGLASAAVGTDGGGSIRIPAACCAVFGLKPGREASRLLDPERHEQWYGLSAVGPMAQSVLDAALLADAMAGAARTDPLAQAACTKPSKLRIAMSLKPAVPGARAGEAVRRPVLETAELLRELGHEVVERDPKYPTAAAFAYSALMMRALPREVGRFPHPQRLERRMRSQVRTARLVPQAAADRALAARPALAARTLELFEEHDALMTPVLARRPVEVGHWEGLGPARSVARTLAFIPFTPVQNFTGQPAASIPVGLDADGVPQAVHLVGRPNDEATILSLAAQIEAERPWADGRPPLR